MALAFLHCLALKEPFADMPLPTKVPATECPCITKEFLEEELRELGALCFSEEYGLEFVDPQLRGLPNLLAAFYGAGGALAAASSEHGGRPCDRSRTPSITNGLRLIAPNCLVTVTFNHL